jgi:hypothetical protein
MEETTLQNSNSGADPDKLQNNKWQKNLLPLIKGMILGLAIFFFLMSLLQLYYLNTKITRKDNAEILKIVQAVQETGNISIEEKIMVARTKTLILLEKESMERRHHQANVSLMSRLWIKYLGFATGMILAFLGALFILGKFEEKTSSLTAKAETSELSLQTASPGIFMTLLGTILMVVTIFVHQDIEVNDGLIYMDEKGKVSAGTGEEKKPVLNIQSIIDTTNNN